MILTDAELLKIRRGLGRYEANYTDEQLQDFADDAYDTDIDTYLIGAVANAFYDLATNYTEMTNFRQGESSENFAVIYDRLWNRYIHWAGRAGYTVSIPTISMRTVRLNYIDISDDELEAEN